MKKIIAFILFAVISISFTYGKKVDLNTAKTVAYQFMIKKAVPGKLLNIQSLYLAYTGVPGNSNKTYSGTSAVDYYVFNLNTTQGFASDWSFRSINTLSLFGGRPAARHSM